MRYAVRVIRNRDDIAECYFNNEWEVKKYLSLCLFDKEKVYIYNNHIGMDETFRFEVRRENE